MAITKLNSLAIPPNTIVESDLSYPLTNFSSTGIDDNATSTAVTIDSSENVGIGTDSPANNSLTIEKTGTARLRLTEAGVRSWDIEATSGSWRVNNASNSIEAMRINLNGNVGIGTSSPDSRLTIEAPTGDYAVLLTPSGDTTGAVTSSYIGFDVRSSTANGPEPAAYIGVEEASTNSVQGHLVFATRQTNNNTVAPTEAMRITSSGRININHQTSGTAGTGSFIVGANSFYIQASQNSSSSTRVPIVFSAIGGTNESMRIDSSGNLLVGKTAPGESAASGNGFSFNSASVDPFFAIVNSNTTGANAGIYINQRNRTATNYLMYFYSNDGSNNTFVGYISHNGTTTSYISASDERLKDNIVDAPAGNIDAIRVRSFDWKADGSHQTYGMVAQELVDVAPEAVSQGETDDDMWGVDYSKLVPMMIKEIQDLKAEVAALKGA